MSELEQCLSRLLAHQVDRRTVLLGFLTVASLTALVASCRPSVLERKINPIVTTRDFNENTTPFTNDELRIAQRLRTDFLNTLREFVPNEYLARGVRLQGDGTGYWASRVKYERPHEGKYLTLQTATMGENGQQYSVSGEYTEDWKLIKSHLRTGNVPSTIYPEHLPKPVPDLTWRLIPRDKMREVAEIAYDLPKGLMWQQPTFESRIPYMSNLPKREFMHLEARGSKGSRRLDFGIDEENWSGLSITPLLVTASTP